MRSLVPVSGRPDHREFPLPVFEGGRGGGGLMRVTLLGCGSSTGTPAIGPNGWGACDPENPKNRRTRASLLVEEGDTTLLVDTSPDLRAQLIGAGRHRIDAVV